MSNRSIFQIDETTWNDLDLDEVIRRIDICKSSVGHEYLKRTIKTSAFDKSILSDRSERAEYISSHKELSESFKKIFTALGVTKKVSFRDHIFKLSEIRPQSNIRHYILALLLVIAIVMLFIRPLIGIIALVVMFVVNISLYFAEKSKIEAYFICVKYLAAMVVAGRKIAVLKLSGTPFEQFASDLVRLNSTFASVKRGSWLITNSVSGSLVDVIMDYIRMLFHVDLIKFNNMRKTAIEHSKEIDELYDILGEIEVAMCISSFRLGNRYCIPVFAEKNEQPAVSFSDIRHPLIEKPIGNSLRPSHAVLLTGSNASGKSTFLKSIAINQIFAQSLYTCLADEYRTTFCKVLSSIALNDNILNNESYFVVEVKSLKRIFDETGDVPVMCFVDEVLRGTNTKERIAASTVILKALSAENAVVFAATHDIELTELLKGYMDNYHFSETVTDTVTFDYKLKEGPSTSRNAIKLLEMYGFDGAIVQEAESLAEG